MMKNVSIMRNMKYGFEENIDENDRNPDWEKAFEQSGLGDKIREMNELQLEGADVYMSTFAQLKSYPFSKTHTTGSIRSICNIPVLYGSLD